VYGSTGAFLAGGVSEALYSPPGWSACGITDILGWQPYRLAHGTAPAPVGVGMPAGPAAVGVGMPAGPAPVLDDPGGDGHGTDF
jgi:hypothetical protein